MPATPLPHLACLEQGLHLWRPDVDLGSVGARAEPGAAPQHVQPGHKVDAGVENLL